MSTVMELFGDVGVGASSVAEPAGGGGVSASTTPKAAAAVAPPKEALLLQGESRQWQLRRQKMLGKGTYGSATLYIDEPTGEQVVVKDVNLQCIGKAEEQALETEIDIMKRSRSHPNIVRYLDRCREGEFMFYILMEYCDKGDLGVWIADAQHADTPPTEALVASVATQLIVALSFLQNDLHVIHRDIKPQNIFWCTNGVVKLGDFGVSTILSSSTDFATVLCGSPFYLPPEVCEEKPYNAKMDMWGVGVTLYELMTLRKPFNGATTASLVQAIRRGAFEKIEPCDGSSHDPQQPGKFSRGLCDLVHSLLQLDPVARPQPKRLLRSSYVTRMVAFLPTSCWSSPVYGETFPEEKWRAKEAANEVTSSANRGASARGEGGSSRVAAGEARRGSPAPSGGAKAELNELEKWLALEGGVDPMDILHGGSQATTPQSTARNAAVASRGGETSRSRPAEGPTRGGGEDDDDAWNRKYDDDAFESDE